MLTPLRAGASSPILDAMSSLRVVLDLDSAAPVPEGCVTEEDDSAAVPFSGWLELMQIVQRRLACESGELQDPTD